MLKYIEQIKEDFQDESMILKNRLILKIMTGRFSGMDIEVGYRGAHIGIIHNNTKQSLVQTSYQNSDTFDENIFDISFKTGSYYLKPLSGSQIFKRFNSLEKHKIFPGHRICAGSQVFTLLQ